MSERNLYHISQAGLIIREFRKYSLTKSIEAFKTFYKIISTSIRVSAEETNSSLEDSTLIATTDCLMSGGSIILHSGGVDAFTPEETAKGIPQCINGVLLRRGINYGDNSVLLMSYQYSQDNPSDKAEMEKYERIFGKLPIVLTDLQ